MGLSVSSAGGGLSIPIIKEELFKLGIHGENIYYDEDSNLILDDDNNPYYTGQS